MYATTITSDTASDALLLTPPQAAKKLAISVRSLYSLFSSGKIKPVKIGRSTRIAASDLSAYVNGLRVAAKS